MMEPARFVAVRPFMLSGRRIEIGEQFECSADAARDILSAGKAQAADDATRRRIKFTAITYWEDSPGGEDFRRTWSAREDLLALRGSRNV